MEISLPEDHGGTFGSALTCGIDDANVRSCTYVSSKIVRIYLLYNMQSTVIRGFVHNFTNPPSVRGMNNVKISVIQSNGQNRMTPFIGSLFNLRSS